MDCYSFIIASLLHLSTVQRRLWTSLCPCPWQSTLFSPSYRKYLINISCHEVPRTEEGTVSLAQNPVILFQAVFRLLQWGSALANMWLVTSLPETILQSTPEWLCRSTAISLTVPKSERALRRVSERWVKIDLGKIYISFLLSDLWSEE
jgi:hypothetical protein